MRKLLILLVPMAATASAGTYELNRVIDTLVEVETEGRARPGDDGLSIGLLQIRPIMVREANRILKRERFTLACRHSPRDARHICRVYLLHMIKRFKREHGYYPRYDRLAEMWNAGNMDRRIPYAAKFRKAFAN